MCIQVLEEFLRTSGSGQLLRHMERMRANLKQLQMEVEEAIHDFHTPSVGRRRNLYMSKLVDDISTVRRRRISPHFNAGR